MGVLRLGAHALCEPGRAKLANAITLLVLNWGFCLSNHPKKPFCGFVALWAVCFCALSVKECRLSGVFVTGSCIFGACLRLRYTL